MEQPSTGWTTPCRVVEVYDGDTVTVECVRRLRVRLTDLWCPEIRGVDSETKAAGFAARDFLASLVADAEEIVLHVPIEDEDFKDRLTMGRVLGKLFVDGRDVSEIMTKAGHGTETK